MAIDRRDFMTGAALSFTSAVCPSLIPPVLAKNSDEMLVSAVRKPDDSFALVVLSADGRIIREFPLQGRGHDFAFDKHTGTVVVFARRPGRFALAFKTRDKIPPKLFAPPVKRHFYGHGTFSDDGRFLYTTENDFDAGLGIIGLYDAEANFTRIGEFTSHGVGPHDVLLLPDRKTLAVANGGIETHPETGREKLNIATMKPSLCFIDIASGDLISRHVLASDLHHLSIRHLAAEPNGTIWFGGQWEGRLDRAPGLIGLARIDEPMRTLEASAPLGAALKGYIGSVAISADARWLAASAPRADRVVYFDTKNSSQPFVSHISDGCGLASIGVTQFAISSGTGALRREMPKEKSRQTNLDLDFAFDNHMLAIS